MDVPGTPSFVQFGSPQGVSHGASPGEPKAAALLARWAVEARQLYEQVKLRVFLSTPVVRYAPQHWI